MVAVGGELRGNHLAEFGEVFVLVVYLGVAGEYFFIKFLAMLCGLEHDDFGDCKFEIAGECNGFVLVHVEHGGKFSCIAVACLEGVEHHLVADFLAEEQGCLVFVGEVHGGNDAIDNLHCIFVGAHCAVFGQLHDGTFHKGFGINFLAWNLCAETLAEGGVLLFHHFVSYVDGVVGHCDVLVKLYVDFGSETDFVFESVVGVVEVDFLDFNGEGFAENVKLVFADIIDYGTINLFVEHVAFHVFAEAATQLVDAYMAPCGSRESGVCGQFL